MTAGSFYNVAGISGSALASRKLRGQFTVTGAATTGGATFTVDDPDASYYLLVTAVASSGSPAADSNRILSIAKGTHSFIATVEAALGGTAVVTFDWVLVR